MARAPRLPWVYSVLALIITSGLIPHTSAQRIADMSVKFMEQQYVFKGIYSLFSPTNVAIMDAALIPLEPITGCEPMAKPLIAPNEGGTKRNWVALAQKGGNCSFYDLTVYAAQAGAVGVVFGNNVPNEILVMRDQEERTSPIPLVSISGHVLLDLHTLATAGASGYTLFSLTAGAQLTLVTSDTTQMLVDASLLLVVVCAISTAVTLFLQIRRWRSVLWAEWVERRRARLLKRRAVAGVQSLPIVTYAGLDVNSCAICMEDFVLGDQQRMLPCTHGPLYHAHCVDAWLVDHRTCPICKRDFTDRICGNYDAAAKSGSIGPVGAAICLLAPDYDFWLLA